MPPGPAARQARHRHRAIWLIDVDLGVPSGVVTRGDGIRMCAKEGTLDMHGRLLVAMLAILGMWQACRGDGTGPDGDGDVDSDSDIDIDVDVDVDVDADSDGDSEDGGDADAGPILAGTVILAEARVDAGTFASSVSLSFRRTDDPECGVRREPVSDECTIETLLVPTCADTCGEGLTCAWDATCTAACLAPPVALNPGDIVISGASHQTRVDCPVSPETGVYTCSLATGSDFWEAGDTLTVAAPGATFPYFSVYTTAPAELTLLTNLDDLTPTRLNGSADLELEWYPGTGDTEVRVVIAATTDGGSRQLVCVTDDDGEIVIPAAALMALSTPAPPTSWTLVPARVSHSVTAEGRDGQVHLYAGSVSSTHVVTAE